MRISGIFSPKRVTRLRTALRLARRWRAAGHLLTANAVVEGGPCPVPEPYDSLLVDGLRGVVAHLSRRTDTGGGLAVRAAAAAFLECRDRGWHCSLHLGAAPHPTRARLDLWGAPVLEVGDPAPDMRCAARCGEVLERVPPRVPTEDDPTVARIEAGEDLAADLTRLLGRLGGLPSLLRPGAKVLLKANFNSYHPAPASTGLDLLTATAEVLRQAGAAHIALGECSAIALGRTRAVLRRAGLPEWAKAQGVQLRCFDEEPWQVCAVPGRHFREIVIPACLPEFDHIIYLLSAKTHRLAGVSLGLKMTIGFLHPAQRLELHRDHLIERIAECSLAVRPDLAVLDARRCFITGGPVDGTVAAPGLLLAARRLEPLEEAGLEVLDAHGAVGLDLGREQLGSLLALRASTEGGQLGHCGE